MSDQNNQNEPEKLEPLPPQPTPPPTPDFNPDTILDEYPNILETFKRGYPPTETPETPGKDEDQQ